MAFGGMKNVRVALLALLLATSVLVLVPSTSLAVPPAPAAAVIDDFEDGDPPSWGFFGGSAAGGGGGVLSDRPYEGGFYLSTGWGGQGSTSVFYGGAVRNFAETDQVTPPADPWFNVWVLNESISTVDQYNLEITLREDLDGNGWTDGVEDSFRLDTTFTSADFDDEWMIVSAPLSGLDDLFTGGDGTFNGDLDEIVIVIAGVQGANPSTVEVDFDLFAFSSGGPLAYDKVVFDDMEHGNPAAATGWFSFTGGAGGGIGPNASDLPPADAGAFSLETGWGSGGTPGFFGGFGRTNPVDISGTDYFNFWINPDEGQDYTLEINLQEDDNGDGLITSPEDDEFQYNCVVTGDGPCATAGGGWQLVSIPLDDFFDDNSFLTGGNGVLDPTANAVRGGNGELINVVIAVVSNSGADVTFRTDYWAFTRGPLVPDFRRLVDDFESGVAPGTPCPPNAPALNFCTFAGVGTITLSNPETPPAPPQPSAAASNVLQLDVNVTDFAGVIRGFEDAGAPAPQDWSTSEGFSFWFHGTGSGTTLFIDILDNRNPGSTVDDAERHRRNFTDDFVGWQRLEFPFSGFGRFEVGNGAPNDGFDRFQVHGWALGMLGTGGDRTYYVDQVELYGEAEPPALAVGFALIDTPIEEGETGTVAVTLNRPFGPEDPAQVSVDYATDISSATAGEEYTPTSGTLTFTSGGPQEQTFPIETFDDTKFEGDERIVLRLSNPVDVELGAAQARAQIVDNDPFDPLLVDDFEQGAFLWEGEGLFDLDAPGVRSTDDRARPGQDSIERVLEVLTPGTGDGLDLVKEDVIDDLTALLPASSRRSTRLIERAIDRIENSLWANSWLNGYFLDPDNGRRVFLNERMAVRKLDRVRGPEESGAQAAVAALVGVDAELAQIALELATHNGGDSDDIARAERQMARALTDLARGRPHKAIGHYSRAWDAALASLGLGVHDDDDDDDDYDDDDDDDDDDERENGAIARLSLGSVSRDFPLGEDWSGTESLSFWYRGTGSGEDVIVELKDNRAPDPGPSGWSMVWSDEFNEAAGTPPNPENWTHEIGDGALNGIEGWGNSELQYYTDDPADAETDGNGNLVMRLRAADGSLQCFYGDCEYTSARLISWHKAEFAYGRIESRLRVPDGGAGLWPAFWSLGTDINRIPWPTAGEIDFMEYVSRLPDEIFGTIHGPGYAGGDSYGGIYDFGEEVFNDFHTFTVEWEPNLITWYVDGIQYHQAAPGDVPGPWVYNKPFFLLLNFAIGGNFGGPVAEGLEVPQEYLLDYVRVYQAPDTAERFEATFTDDFAGWQEVTVPIADFVRSADQPAGAPNDGLGLDEVWGYGFDLPYPAAGSHQFDQVRRTLPIELTVTTLADDGDGSLRKALASIADGGTITFDPSLAGGTIGLTSGQLVVDRSVTVDASAAPGVVVSGSGMSRVFEIAATATVAMNDLEVADGAGEVQGGGILNLGTLSLDRVVVRDNVESDPSPSVPGVTFDRGGGGIYAGDGATLSLNASTVADNASLNHNGGGIYGFFGSTITVTDTTISGNTGGDVGGGLRTLGDLNVVNSTISGNESTKWHGGGAFVTNGIVSILNSTITGNTAPGGTAGGLMIAAFGAPVELTLQNSIVAANGSYGCQVEGGGATFTSRGNNVSTDMSCVGVASDQVVADALLGLLADNGGPTLTHLPAADSPAIDAADATSCPAVDQRGVLRPQGAGCDVGAVEVESG